MYDKTQNEHHITASQHHSTNEHCDSRTYNRRVPTAPPRETYEEKPKAEVETMYLLGVCGTQRSFSLEKNETKCIKRPYLLPAVLLYCYYTYDHSPPAACSLRAKPLKNKVEDRKFQDCAAFFGTVVVLSSHHSSKHQCSSPLPVCCIYIPVQCHALYLICARSSLVVVAVVFL